MNTPVHSDPHGTHLTHATSLDSPHEGPDHGSMRTYLIGFALSVLLTAIPFWLVMSGALGSKKGTALAISVLAVGQIFVHMIYFLHMNRKAEGGWSLLALIFTLVIVVIALSGSLWVMYHLNTNMMPGHDMSQMP